LVHKN